MSAAALPALIVGMMLVFAHFPGAPANAASPRTGQIDISYTKPRNALHEPIAAGMRSSGALEKLQRYLSPLRLPRRLLLKLASCNGDAEAWYEDGTITVCYEYLHDVSQAANHPTRPPWLTANDILSAGLLDVFLHEVAHALFEQLSIPVLGSEEMAADQFATLFILGTGQGQSRALVMGAAFIYQLEMNERRFRRGEKAWEDARVGRLSDVHGLPAQRAYTALCIAYGSNPRLFAELITRKLLPSERASDCEDEYVTLEHAWRVLIAPHIDLDLLRKLQPEQWIGQINY